MRNQINNGMLTFCSKHTKSILFGGVLFLISYYFITLVIKGHRSLGFFIAYSMYLRMLFNNISGYGTMYQNIISSSPSFERVFGLLDANSTSIRQPKNVKNSYFLPNYNIEIKDLCYTVPPPKSISLFDKASFNIHFGELVVLTGRNGVGKTTLVNLLSGVLEPDEGIVSIGGGDVYSLSPSLMRKTLAVVYCDDHCSNFFDMQGDFSGNFEAFNQDILKLLEMLKQGQQECVNEKSSGERYLNSLIFAIMKQVKILILDEPLANLDARHTQLILKLFRLLKGKMTIIVVSHEIELFKTCANVIYNIADKQISPIF